MPSSSTGCGVTGIPIIGVGVSATIGIGVSGLVSEGLAVRVTGIIVVNSGVGGNVGSDVGTIGAAVGLDATENVVTCEIVKASYDWRIS